MNSDMENVKIFAAAILRGISYTGGRSSDGSYYERPGITSDGVSLLKAASEGNISIDPDYFEHLEYVKGLAAEIRKDSDKYDYFNPDPRMPTFRKEREKLQNMVKAIK